MTPPPPPHHTHTHTRHISILFICTMCLQKQISQLYQRCQFCFSILLILTSLLIDAVKQSMQCIRNLYGEITLALTETNTMAVLIHKTMHRAERLFTRFIMKWNEWGFRPPLCTYRLNWVKRTSWGWWDEWDDPALRTHDLKFESCRFEAEHATSRSRRLPTILNLTRFRFCYQHKRMAGLSWYLIHWIYSEVQY